MPHAQQQAAGALKKLGGRVSADDGGTITAVDLAQTAITDVDLELLADCPGIVELNLRGTLASDAGLKSIAALGSLEFLGLTGTMVTDDGLAHLQQLANLRFLTLGHTAVTDDGIKALGACQKLEGLNLKGTAVSAAALVQLQSQLPNCRIVSDVTSTTSIESQDLPAPMLEDSGDTAAPASSPANSTDPFAPLPPGKIPAAPQEIPVPAAGQNSARRLNRPVTENGPARRLDRVISESLNDPSVLRAIAQTYSDREEWDAAAAVLRTAVEHAPNDQQLQFELGVAEARSGDFVAALMHLQQCGDLAVAHYNLGILLHEAGLTDASILAFRSALRYEPGLSQAHIWLSMLSAEQADAASAAGRRPSMIGARAVTPVDAWWPGDEAATQQASAGDIAIHPARK